MTFDVETHLIGIDNHATRSMCNDKHMFTNLTVSFQGNIKGIGGHKTKIEGFGTVRWNYLMIEGDYTR